MQNPRRITFRRTILGSPEAADAKVAGSASERIALVRILSLSAWNTSGQPLPRYSRAEIPFRRTRLGERRDRD
jgi:hypothetical protein